MMSTDQGPDTKRRGETAERRQLTALFYDLVGSTLLVAGLDPEDMRSLQQAFHAACTAVIARYGGFLDKYVGDGAGAFFGYPTAHEDDAERAVSAGLGIVDACRHLLHPSLGEARLSVRVGIATGIVVAGEHAGPRSEGYSDVVGLAPNLATRLQSVAPPNSVLISSATHDLIRGFFECQPYELLTLKGFAEQQQSWRVVASRRGLPRFEARRRDRRPRFISRTEELEVMQRRWDLAGQGHGQVVLLAGEPGIGKSRLVDSFHHRIASPGAAPIIFQCLPYHSDVPLHPVVNHLERAIARNGPPSSPKEPLANLEALLAESTDDPASAAALLASLLSLPSPDAELVKSTSPETLKRRQLACLLEHIDGLSRSRRVLVVFEDVHWIDPSSEELLDLLIERASEQRTLVAVTFRPDYVPRWIGQAHVVLISLNRLDKEQSATLVASAAGRPLSESVINQIVARADGVPLFLEELTQTVMDVANESVAGAEPVIPATLSDSLMARLDQLGDAKEIAFLASAIGRAFSADLITRVADRPREEVERALASLVDRGLAMARSGSEGGEYVFKHALIQESAYQAMLRSRRRVVHQRIAEVLSAGRAVGRGVAPDILARHYEAAGLAEEAIPLLNEAARSAVSHSANLEAGRLLDRALRLIPKIAEDSKRKEQELELLVSLGPILITTSGAGSSEVQALYRRATRLCAEAPLSAAHFAANWGWWLTSPNFSEMRRRADTLSDLAVRLEDPELRLQAHHCQWGTLFNLARYQTCLEHIAAGLTIYEEAQYRSQGVLYGGHDPKACALGQKSLALWLLGSPEESAQACTAAVQHAESLRHAGSIGHALDFELMLCRYRGDAERAARQAEGLVRLAAAQSFKDLSARARIFQGWATVMLGHSAGIRQIELGISAQLEIGTEEDFPVYYEMLAEALGAAGRADEGLGWVDKAIALAEKAELQFWSAELHRRRGELLLQTGGSRERAIAAFHHACDLAKAQSARSLLDRAATSLARATGIPDAAQDTAPTTPSSATSGR